MTRSSSFVLVLGLLGGLPAQVRPEVSEPERALLARVEYVPSTPVGGEVVQRTSPLDGEAALLNHGKTATGPGAQSATSAPAAPIDGARALLNVAAGSERGRGAPTPATPASAGGEGRTR